MVLSGLTQWLNQGKNYDLVGTIPMVYSGENLWFHRDKPYALMILEKCGATHVADNLAHLLDGADTSGHKGESELILDEAHFMEQCLHAGRISIDKEQFVELGELVMDAAGRLVFTTELQSDHARELTWQGIANDGDDTSGTTCYHGECQGIVATEHIEAVGLQLDDFIDLFE